MDFTHWTICSVFLRRAQPLSAAAVDSIRVLPISRGEKREVVEEFIASMGYTFNVGLDPDQKAYNKYALNFIPRCFVIEADGNVLYSGVGYDEAVAAEVRDALDQALAK